MDLNGNGMSDVWEYLFDANGADPNLDSDGDGVPNDLESIAGTNPFDSNSVPKIPPLVFTTTNASVTLPSALGKKYELQTVEILCSPVPASNWVTEATFIPRSGTQLTLTAPANTPTKFFRVVIADVDTDGDGLNDWEEYQLGLDPLNAASSGQLDGNGQPLGDMAYATARLGLQNNVTIVATDASAVEPDPNQPATSTGTYTITRGGFPLNSVTVNLGLGGPGTNYAIEGLDFAAISRPIVFPAGVSSETIDLKPLANTNRTTPVVALLKILPGAKYVPGAQTNASIVIYPSITPNGTGLTGNYFTNSSTTYSSTRNFNPTNLFLTRIDPTIDFIWFTNLSPNLSNGLYTVRWTGQVQPEYSETYYFDIRSDDGVKLWVNDLLLIDKWRSQGATDWITNVALQGGVRYNIRLDYLQAGGSASARLYWYSASQPKQIVPANRLYPLATNAPAVITSELKAYAFLGQPFSFNLTAANSPLSFTATGLPPGLVLNSTNGLISGVPTLAGNYSVSVTASNSVGSGASVLDIEVIETGSAVTREVWTNVPGTTVADIPVNTTADLISSFGALEGITDYGDDYAERVRGYITAPVTGNYYFWIAGSDSAELWISNDSEPVNKVRRAYTTSATGVRQWNLQPNQKSGWLALEAGQRYYLEILHKAGTGANDNWSIGWVLDNVGTNNTPGGIVPGYLLSHYFEPPTSFIPGTLYAANMLAQGTAVSSGVGSATLRVSADGTQAVLRRTFSGLSSSMTGEHIHCDPYLSHPSQIMFDIDATPPQPDGSYVWNIAPVGTLSTDDILEIIREGKAYINIHTVNYPAGEINGHFTLAEGSQIFTPPPAPPTWTDDHTSTNATARFLIQATFGPSLADIAAVQALGYDGWISNQFTLPATHHLPNVLANRSADLTRPYPGNLTFNTWWQNSVTAPDQLRQRVAFALSEIMVVSENGVLQDNARALSHYYDTLLDDAFGNFRDLLKDVTLTPAMGLYLDMRRNDKGDITLGTHANENYAREIMQLFSIGLNRLWPDGTLIMNSQGNLVPTYDQNVVNGFAAVFTGWNYYQTNQANGRLPTSWNPSPNYTNSMVLVPTHHDLNSKRLLDNVMLPAAFGNQADSGNTNYDNYGLQNLDSALDSIFYNENVGPFICRQLIQRLVTSNPSRDYVYRVAQKFNNNGSGVRGDMRAVIKAILLDYEARSSTKISLSTFGKQREPVLRVTAVARAFPSPPTTAGTYSQSGTDSITITTTNAHRLNNNDDVFLILTDTSGHVPPTSQAYNNVHVTSPASFTVSAPGVFAAAYSQTGTTINIITNSSHGLTVGNLIHLTFTSGGGSNGVYEVASVPTTTNFTVIALDSVSRSGRCLFLKWTGGGFTQSGTNITVSIAGNHALNPGDAVFINFPAGSLNPDTQYEVLTVPDTTHFTIGSSVSTNRTDNNPIVLPLVPPPLNRSGNVTVQFSTWNLNTTDTGTSSSLGQTPLNSPTVFNFFSPDYKFPGLLASAGLTTPEFQLTSDSSVALQMNFMEGGLLTSTGNTNGLSSFTGGDGDIMLDVGPWMTTNFTSNTGVSTLIDSLNSLLCAGQLSANAKTRINAYVTNTTNFPYSTTPTATQMRDRVRATAHLIVSSPDFIIQK